MPKNRVVVRLDDRLIHGQVIYSWLRRMEPEEVMIVHESLSELQKALLRSAAEKRYSLWMGDAVQAVAHVNLSKSVLMLLASPAELQRLVAAGYRPEVVVLGALGWLPGRERISAQVYMSREEKELLSSLAAQGIRYVIQARYDDTPTPWYPEQRC